MRSRKTKAPSELPAPGRLLFSRDIAQAAFGPAQRQRFGPLAAG